ncbi:hypothetical protein E5A72_00115 (plasmid) [Acinetobacter baumannii ATCC 17978]|nr:hypothetical protein E5A72_00115 [Acinetobacter baumannii ATCC 17978]
MSDRFSQIASRSHEYAQDLSNELSLNIVGVGTREAITILHTDPQYASRFDVVNLPKWELNQDFLDY